MKGFIKFDHTEHTLHPSQQQKKVLEDMQFDGGSSEGQNIWMVYKIFFLSQWVQKMKLSKALFNSFIDKFSSHINYSIMICQAKFNQENRQKYLSHPFTLYNLLEGLNVPPIFTVAVSQIFTIEDQTENMTFGAQIFGVKILKSKDNILRILYYSLLCYLFQLKDHMLTEVIKNKFVFYILNNLKTILPASYQSNHYLRISKKPFLTTSQIKSCFMKFMHLLERKPKQSKMIIQELNTLPQMDFIFMSIFKSLVNYKVDKNGTIVIPEEQLSNLQQKIGFNFKIGNEQIILQNQFHIKLIDKSLEIDQFVIEKYYQPKTSSVVNSKLIRKDTTQSVGFVDQEENTRQTQSILGNSTKLVLSQSTDQLENSNKSRELKNSSKEFQDLNQFINNNFKLQPETRQLNLSPLNANPFSKKTTNLPMKTQGNQPTQQYLISNKRPNLRFVSPRLSQFLRERSQSKSRSKIEQNGGLRINNNDFRTHLTFKSKLNTQQPQQHQNHEKRQSFSVGKYKKSLNPQFCSDKVSMFGNPKLIIHQNNFSKQNRPNANRDIFKQISSPILSPKSQNGRAHKKKECHASICGRINFKTNPNIQPFHQFQTQNSMSNLRKYEDRQYSFKIRFNQQKTSNGQIISKYTLAK